MDHQTVYLADYQPPSFFITEVDLEFELDPEETIVRSKLKVHRNKEQKSTTLELDGEELTLVEIHLDGHRLNEKQYEVGEKGLKIFEMSDEAIVEIKVKICPKENTHLEGLYVSDDYLTTQNEAQGFRRITYMCDRPDVMSKYTTKLIGDKESYPQLLSNGNLIDQGDLEDGRHYCVWQDPFAKPCYLFALVAGSFGLIESEFKTMSGRKVALKFYCDEGDEEKCEYALASLIEAMKWDEETFGREYDLDIFMIVAISSFNAGAMENKGLNIFNSIAVLADPDIATDANFIYVQRVIAHEYFHNWTGDRITCRDWFQLTLKEGLTVYRDQEFSSDMNVRPLQRIKDAKTLKEVQFPEDLGPTSHPIQPKSYMEINNFYTSTVYNKGAEVIRMIEVLIGKEAFRLGCDRYFELYDGMAVTTEEFVSSMEVASGVDLKQFRLWYDQNGIPEVDVEYRYDEENKQFELTVHQKCEPMVTEVDHKPFCFPLKVGLMSVDGKPIDFISEKGRKEGENVVLTVSKASQTYTFTNVKEEPLPSVNRGFSAPIIVNMPYEKHDYFTLMHHDSDPYNAFEAGQRVASDLMQEQVDRLANSNPIEVDTRFLSTLGDILKDTKLDAAIRAHYLTLPSETVLMQGQNPYQIESNFEVREFFKFEIARAFEYEFQEIYNKLNVKENYQPEVEQMGRRSLKNLAMSYLAQLGNNESIERLAEQYRSANNLTDRYAALSLLCHFECSQKDEVLADFYNRHKSDQLVMMKWLSAQAASKLDSTFETVQKLTQDPIFDYKVPNLSRALHLVFASNHARFHSQDEPIYPFYADEVLKIDKINPHAAARLCGAFKKVRKLDDRCKDTMTKEMERMLRVEGLSRNVYEILDKSLGDR